jgi:integrase
MRISELLALTRSSVYLTRANLHVSATGGALHEVAGHRTLGPPKTPAAVRDVALPPFLVDGLERLLNAHPYDTVFCAPTGRWLWRTDFVNRRWRPACDGHPHRGWLPIVAGMHFHDLRHTHRTWLDEDNVSEAAKAHRLGHAIPGIRGVYAHTTPIMTLRLLANLQTRWLDHGGYW